MSGIGGISGNLFLNQLFKNLKSGILVGFDWYIVIKQYIKILINKIKTLKYKKRGSFYTITALSGCLWA